jgi:hypothetical protein
MCRTLLASFPFFFFFVFFSFYFLFFLHFSSQIHLITHSSHPLSRIKITRTNTHITTISFISSLITTTHKIKNQ